MIILKYAFSQNSMILRLNTSQDFNISKIDSQLMQSNESIKLDDLIEFFKTKRDELAQRYNSYNDDYKYAETEFMSILAIFISIAIVFLDIDKLYGIILILCYIAILCIYKYISHIKNLNVYAKYSYKIIICDTVIEFLWYLKISHTEVDLSPLVAKIEQLFSDNRALNIKEDYEKIWVEEVIKSVDIINYKRRLSEKPVFESL